MLDFRRVERSSSCGGPGSRGARSSPVSGRAVDFHEGDKIGEEALKEVAKRLKTERESGMTQRSNALICCTTFGEFVREHLGELDLFKTVLADSRAVARVLT